MPWRLVDGGESTEERFAFAEGGRALRTTNGQLLIIRKLAPGHVDALIDCFSTLDVFSLSLSLSEFLRASRIFAYHTFASQTFASVPKPGGVRTWF